MKFPKTCAEALNNFDGLAGDLFFIRTPGNVDGATFTLYKEKHHTTSHVNQSKRYIKQNFDAILIRTERLKEKI